MPRLNQKSWVELFTSINGRPPTATEYQEALKKGEFFMDRESSSNLEELSPPHSKQQVEEDLEGPSTPTYETDTTIARQVPEFEQAPPSFTNPPVEHQFEQSPKEGSQVYYSNPYVDKKDKADEFDANSFDDDNKSAGLKQFFKLLVVIGLVVGFVYGAYAVFQDFPLSGIVQKQNLDGDYIGEYNNVEFDLVIKGKDITVTASKSLINGIFTGKLDFQTRQIEFNLLGKVKVSGEYKLDGEDILIIVDGSETIRLEKQNK